MSLEKHNQTARDKGFAPSRSAKGSAAPGSGVGANGRKRGCERTMGCRCPKCQAHPPKPAIDRPQNYFGGGDYYDG